MNESTEDSYNISGADLLTKLVGVTLKPFMCNFLSSSQFPGIRAHSVDFLAAFSLFKGYEDKSIFLWDLTGLMLCLSPSQLAGCCFCPLPSWEYYPFRFCFSTVNLIKDTCNKSFVLRAMQHLYMGFYWQCSVLWQRQLPHFLAASCEGLLQVLLKNRCVGFSSI